MVQPRHPRQFRRQEPRLIIAPTEKPRPMQRHRRHDHAGFQQRLGHPVQPGAEGARQIDPVGVFQLQDQITRPVPVQHHGPPARPWPGNAQTIVAVHRVAIIRPGQGCAAQIADKARQERRFPPAPPAHGKIRRHPFIAANALRRVDQMQHGLHSRHRTLMFRAMQTPPTLCDRTALARNRARATEFFLHEEVRLEVEERLTEVNRTFTAPVIVTPFAQVWAETGITVPDDEILDLTAQDHDLVVHALCLHWANDPVGQLVQCRRALGPDGLFLGFLLGGQTLHELRACLAEAEAEVTGGLSPRVLPMGEIRDLGALLQRAGFALPVADSFTKTVRYRDAGHLMRDLRAMGEGNALAARLRRPTRRAVLARAAALYQSQYADSEGRIPATFEVICLTGWAPHESQQKPLRPGSAVQRLADALATSELRLPPTDSDG